MTAGNGLAVAAGYKRKEFGVEAVCIRDRRNNSQSQVVLKIELRKTTLVFVS
jgi:hypothetical protein